jgi:hypothetical protein
MKEFNSGFRKDLLTESDSATEADCCKAEQTMFALKSKVSTAPSEFSCAVTSLKKLSPKKKPISKKKPQIVLK